MGILALVIAFIQVSNSRLDGKLIKIAAGFIKH